MVGAVIGLNALHAKDNRSEGNIKFYTDVACFKMLNQQGVTYTQLYFYSERNQFSFLPKDSLFTAAFTIRVVFTDIEDEKNVTEKQWTMSIDDHITVNDTAKEIPVIFENSFAVKPGKYKLQIQMTDDNNKAHMGVYNEDIEVPDFGNSQLNLSQIELSTQVLKGGNNDDMFVKNGYTIFPNPSRFYGSNLPRLTLYAELYNLEYEAGSTSNTYGADFILTDEAGSVVKEFPSKTFNKAGLTAIIIHSLNVISIQSGRYYLLLRVTDHTSKKPLCPKSFCYLQGR